MVNGNWSKKILPFFKTKHQPIIHLPNKKNTNQIPKETLKFNWFQIDWNKKPNFNNFFCHNREKKKRYFLFCEKKKLVNVEVINDQNPARKTIRKNTVWYHLDYDPGTQHHYNNYQQMAFVG